MKIPLTPNLFKILSAVLCLSVLAQPALAVENTRALATDNRIKVVAYQRDNVVPITASTFTSTQVVFPPYLLVADPGVGNDPRVPQNRTLIAPLHARVFLPEIDRRELDSRRVSCSDSSPNSNI